MADQGPVLYIVRHGSTGDDEKFNSPVNPPLDAQGKRDAKEVADFFRGKKTGRIVSSALDRSKETSEAIARATGKPAFVIEPNIDSLNVGDVKDMKNDQEADRVIHHHQENPEKKIPGGESINDFRRRVRPEFAEEIEQYDKTGEPSIMSSHHSIQHEAGQYFNGDKDSATSAPGGVVAVYKTPDGYRAEVVFKPEHRGTMKKQHKFSHTVIEHHGDGSHTVHHIHEKHGHSHTVPTREGDVKGGAGDHDAMMDHVMDHTSMPNPGEDKDVNNQPLAAPGAAPAPVAPPAA